jgi:hypothetical protein
MPALHRLVQFLVRISSSMVGGQDGTDGTDGTVNDNGWAAY